MLAGSKSILLIAMVLSLALHAFALYGFHFTSPKPVKLPEIEQAIDVVLVNSRSKSKPVKADALAQANLDGGGNTAEDRQAKSMLPNRSHAKQPTPESAAKKVAQLEEQSKRMMTSMKSSYTIDQVKPDPGKAEDLVQLSLEMARLEAQINRNNDFYQKLPRRKFIGARTQEYRFAQYVEDWRIKVERIGNMNYPQQARVQQVYGKLQLSVSIRADGSVENIEISKSSGHRILDAAAMRIVKLAQPFSPLPPNITRDTDILTITRTWSFTPSDRLESE